MKEQLKMEITSLNEELEDAKERFNDRLKRNPIGIAAYNQVMRNLLCIRPTPCDSAYKFYETYNRLFDFAENLKASHPEFGKAVLTARLEKFCVEDEATLGYFVRHLAEPSQESIALFANRVVDVHNTLVNLGFGEIIAKGKNIREKEDELAYLEATTPDTILPTFECIDVQLDKIGDATRSLVNKGAKKLLKLASFVIDRTDKK